MDRAGSITDVAGVAVGHHTDAERGTGLTVIILPEGSTGSVEVRGGAPGTRETDLLRPENTVNRVDALLFAGGSAFGLDAAAGLMEGLREADRGFRVGDTVVPIVPGAVIFDEGAMLGFAPGPAEARRAFENADTGAFRTGRVGAGTGATVGKVLGHGYASPGGLGTASVVVPGGLRVGAMAVVNALGDIIGENGETLAGIGKGADVGSEDLIMRSEGSGIPGASTTLVAVVTDARLTKAEALRVAVMAGDGLARSIRPSHTPFDGDAVFVLSTGDGVADVLRIGTAAALAVERAIRNSVR